MNDIKDIFVEIKQDLKEIRKENKDFSVSINSLYNKVLSESYKRENNTIKIEDITVELEALKKEKINLNKRVQELNIKQLLIEDDIKENINFKEKLKANFWKGFWWFFGVVGSAVSAAITFFISR